MISSNLYLVRYFDPGIKEEDYIVYKSSSLSRLFNEIIDLLGSDADVYSIEKIDLTDLDILEV